MITEPTSGDDYLAAEAPTLIETPEEIEYEMRSAEGAMWTGGHLVIGIGAFFFASLAFAYFYLRSTNSEDLWRPDQITAPTGIGAAIFALIVASALMNGYGTIRLRRGETLDWEVAGLGGGRRWAHGPRSAGVGVHQVAVLPRLERLRLLLRRLGHHEHQPHPGRPATGWRRCWPAGSGCGGR